MGHNFIATMQLKNNNISSIWVKIINQALNYNVFGSCNKENNYTLILKRPYH